MHVPYLIYALAILDNTRQQCSVVAQEVESLTASFVTVGVLFQLGAGWHLTPRPLTHDGRRPLEAALSLASTVFSLEHVSTVRACKGVVAMPVLSKYVGGEVIMWRRGGDVAEVVHFSPRARIYVCLSRRRGLAQEIDEVNEAIASWQEVCFVQLLSVNEEDVHQVVEVAPNIHLIGGAGATQNQIIVSVTGRVQDESAEPTRHAAAPCPERTAGTAERRYHRPCVAKRECFVAQPNQC